MGIPARQKVRLGSYVLSQVLAGRRRFPVVLMLEPLFRCNLRCPGCGKIDYPEEILSKRLSVADCLHAVEECGAPVVSIAGGEPLLHPEIHQVVSALVARRVFVYLCTNALLVEKRIGDFSPSPHLTFNIHLDGLRERHDAAVARAGVFDHAVETIRLLLARGFRVTTNTTFYSGETVAGGARLFDFISGLGVEGMTVTAAFGYESGEARNTTFDRCGSVRFFGELFSLGRGRGWKFNHSPTYLEFLSGRRDYACSPWGSPTRNIFGWQQPCYLLDDRHVSSYRELMETTDWKKWGADQDSRCASCLMHCGFEPTAILDAVRHPLQLLKASLRGG